MYKTNRNNNNEMEAKTSASTSGRPNLNGASIPRRRRLSTRGGQPPRG